MIDATIRMSDDLPLLGATLTDANNDPVDLTGATVKLELRGATVDFPTTEYTAIVTGTPGTVTYQWDTGNVVPAGLLFARWHVTYAGGDTESFPNSGNGFVIEAIP